MRFSPHILIFVLNSNAGKTKAEVKQALKFDINRVKETDNT